MEFRIRFGESLVDEVGLLKRPDYEMDADACKMSGKREEDGCGDAMDMGEAVGEEGVENGKGSCGDSSGADTERSGMMASVGSRTLDDMRGGREGRCRAEFWVKAVVMDSGGGN